MSKTAIEKAIGMIKSKSDNCLITSKIERARKGAYVDAILILRELLPTERQQSIDFATSVIIDQMILEHGKVYDDERKITTDLVTSCYDDYYNQTFNQPANE